MKHNHSLTNAICAIAASAMHTAEDELKHKKLVSAVKAAKAVLDLNRALAYHPAARSVISRAKLMRRD